MPTGTLLVELTAAPVHRPTQILSLPGPTPESGLALTVEPGGHIRACQTEDGDEKSVTLPFAGAGGTVRLRISLVWKMAIGHHVMWIEQPDFAAPPRSTTLPLPVMVSRSALIRAAAHPAGHLAEDVIYFAATDRLNPVGPMPTLAGSTPVLTPSGHRPIDQIAPGDPVIVRDANGRRVTIPVLANLRRRLPARGGFRPVHLRSPYFGLSADIRVAAEQKLVIAGTDVEYLFAQERVLVPAGLLTGPHTGRYLDGPDTVIWHQLLLPDQQLLEIGHCGLESLHVGALRRSAEAHAGSLLADLPRRSLPHHAGAAFPVLKEYEAATLTAQRSR